MISVMNLWSLIFWLGWFLFFLNTTNTIKLLITSELIWIIIYAYTVLIGVVIDDVLLLALSFLLLALASVEFAIGFILTIIFKKLFKTVDLSIPSGTDTGAFKRYL